MSRLDQQSDEYLVSRVQYLRQTLDDMRALQTFGSSNFALYNLRHPVSPGSIQPAAEISVTMAGPTIPYCIEVTLTPASTVVPNPSIALAFQVFLVSGSARYVISPLPPVSGVQKWHVWTSAGGSGTTVQTYGFIFLTIANATWSVVQIV